MADTALKPLAVVTGGSSGIGYELAKEFIASGYDVLISAETAGFGLGGPFADTKAGASDRKDDPADVAKASFEALQADKDKVMPLAKTTIMGSVAAAAAMHRGMSKPGSAKA